MDWDQKIFKKVLRWLSSGRRGATDLEETAEAVNLEELKTTLTILANCLTGASISIFAAEEEGGVSANTFFLPKRVAFFDSAAANRDYYLFRTVFLAKQRSLGLGWHNGDPSDLSRSREEARRWGPQVLEQMRQDTPGVKRLLEGFGHRFSGQEHWLFGKWLPWNHTEGDGLTQLTTGEESVVAAEDHTERQGPARELVTNCVMDRKAIEDYTLMHQFEKVETIEAFNGNWRDLDGSDELRTHEDALEEVDLRHTVRVNEPVHATLKSDFLRNGYIPFSRDHSRPGHHVFYDEWDYQKKALRPRFCKVYPSSSRVVIPGYGRKVLTEQRWVYRALEKKFSRFFNVWERQHHQQDGDELNLDRTIDYAVERQVGLPGDERVFFSKKRQRKDLSLLILMDLSLSTDSYVENRKILDVEKQAVVIFGELMHGFHCRFRIDGFSSQTRNNCDFLTVKTFDDTWNVSKDRLGALKSAGYTRIGPALRHATHELKQEDSRNRWILLLSDGKPNDFDRYEGRYGIEDVREAIREAQHFGIHHYALAVDRGARFYLPRMFGHQQFQIMNHPHQLVEALSDFFIKVYRLP